MPKDSTSPQLPKLGKRIKELREKKGLTQTGLAQASGVSRVYISGIEGGIRNLTSSPDRHRQGVDGAAGSADRLSGIWRSYFVVSSISSNFVACSDSQRAGFQGTSVSNAVIFGVGISGD